MRRTAVAFLLFFCPLLLHAGDDPVAKALAAMQPNRIGGAPPRTDYLVVDRWPDRSPRTIVTVLFFDADADQLPEVAAFRVKPDRSLVRLASQKGGDFSSLELRDVTGDGVPEVLAWERPGNRTASCQILKWDRTAFTRIGQTSTSASFIDLDHDGLLEIVGPGVRGHNQCGVVIETYVDKLRDGVFVNETPEGLVDVAKLVKSGDEPEWRWLNLSMPDSFALSCRMHIVNGDRDGKHRATALNVSIDKGAVIKTSLTARTEFLDVPVHLPSHCSAMDVEVSGPAGATVVIMVEAVPAK